MPIKRLFKPKPNRFVQLLLEQTSLTLEGLGLLKAYMEKFDHEMAKDIALKEKEADEVRRILIEELMRTFVTPFDREDIFALSREIDDVLDYANTTVVEMEILHVEPTPFMMTIASHLYEAVQEMLMAVERLQDKHPNVASDHTQRAKHLENQVEGVYREAIADLFNGPKNLQHVLTVLKVREIYRHLSNAADRVDYAANVIADIVIKMS
jgi:predicted phosphate transport protein (TIGR00153 family)